MALSHDSRQTKITYFRLETRNEEKTRMQKVSNFFDDFRFECFVFLFANSNRIIEIRWTERLLRFMNFRLTSHMRMTHRNCAQPTESIEHMDVDSEHAIQSPSSSEALKRDFINFKSIEIKFKLACAILIASMR